MSDPTSQAESTAAVSYYARLEQLRQQVTPQVDSIYTNSRFDRTDSFDQFDTYFWDPVTGVRSDAVRIGGGYRRDGLALTGEETIMAGLRIAQNKYTHVARQMGFAPMHEFRDPTTGQPVDTRTHEGFQRYYEAAQAFVRERSQNLAATLQAEGRFIPPYRDPLTGQELPEDSLITPWMRDRLTTNRDTYTEERFQEWQRRGQKKEHFIIFYLDVRNQLMKKEVISIGNLNTSIVHPREVFEPAVRDSVAQIILTHNHPSGIVDPSEADVKLTRRLVKAGEILGIEIIDHIIVCEKYFLSMKEKGII